MSPPFTVKHPYVKAYLEHATASMLDAEEHAHDLLSSGCTDMGWHQLSDHNHCTNWWRVQYGGVARPEHVADALGLPDNGTLSMYDAERIFAVAALAVYPYATHPAHWAFWAKNARYRVAEVVHEVVCERTKRIVVPGNVAWIDQEYNLTCLAVYQKGWMPLTPRPSGEHGDAPPPKKQRVCVKTRTSARRGRKPAVQVEIPAPSDMNENGKRAAPMEDALEASTPKRQRRKATAGASSAKKVGKGKAQSNAKGERITRASTTQKTRASTRTAAKSAEKAPSPPPSIRIVPPSKANASEAVNGEDRRTSLIAAPCGQPRDSSGSLNAAFSLSPLSSPPNTPPHGTSSSEPASPTPKRPAGRALPRRAISVAHSECSELSLAPSATLTLVASTAASDACSTRAGTPLDDVAFPEKAKSQVGPSRTSRTPMRASARIQARKGGSNPETSDPSSLANRSSKKRRS